MPKLPEYLPKMLSSFISKNTNMKANKKITIFYNINYTKPIYAKPQKYPTNPNQLTIPYSPFTCSFCKSTRLDESPYSILDQSACADCYTSLRANYHETGGGLIPHGTIHAVICNHVIYQQVDPKHQNGNLPPTTSRCKACNDLVCHDCARTTNPLYTCDSCTYLEALSMIS